MPPPPSPVSNNDRSSMQGDLQNNLPSERPSHSASTAVSSRPPSSTSQRSGTTEELSILEQLQSRLDAAEYENERLRAAADLGASVASSAEQLQIERQEALDKYIELQEKFTALEERLASQANELEILREEKEKLLLDLSDAASQQQQTLAAHQLHSEERSAEMNFLQQRLDELEHLNLQKDGLNASQILKIEDLSTNLQQSYLDFQEEKKELAMQVDELRVAGQVRSFCK